MDMEILGFATLNYCRVRSNQESDGEVHKISTAKYGISVKTKLQAIGKPTEEAIMLLFSPQIAPCGRKKEEGKEKEKAKAKAEKRRHGEKEKEKWLRHKATPHRQSG